MINPNLKVAILMPTRNRADFVIRQIQYYASVNCPHTIYIGDSSNQEESEKIRSEVNALKDKIEIVYEFLPTLLGGSAGAAKHLLSMVKEKYACYSCDDDYQIPNSLTICAEFLENNPDYATTGGHSLSFRLKNNGAYGELASLKDWPVPKILDESASKRLIHFLSDNFVPLFFVNRTEQMLESHKHVLEIKDHMFGSEIVPCALSIVAGKSTTLDCLGYIRQIHDQHYVQMQPSEWLTSQTWNESYKTYENLVSAKISKKDNLPISDTVRIARQAFSGQIIKWLAAENRNNNDLKTTNRRNKFYKTFLKNLRSKVVKIFPFAKYLYRVLVNPRLTGKRELHYQVTRPASPYYKDFKPISDSFTGLIKK